MTLRRGYLRGDEAPDLLLGSDEHPSPAAAAPARRDKVREIERALLAPRPLAQARAVAARPGPLDPAVDSRPPSSRTPSPVSPDSDAAGSWHTAAPGGRSTVDSASHPRGPCFSNRAEGSSNRAEGSSDSAEGDWHAGHLEIDLDAILGEETVSDLLHSSLAARRRERQGSAPWPGHASTSNEPSSGARDSAGNDAAAGAARRLRELETQLARRDRELVRLREQVLRLKERYLDL